MQDDLDQARADAEELARIRLTAKSSQDEFNQVFSGNKLDAVDTIQVCSSHTMQLESFQ